MAITRRVTQSVLVGSDLISGTVSHTAGAAVALSEAVGDTWNDQAVAFNLNIANCVLLYMKCDRSLTIKVNNSGTPEATLSLYAGQPFVWVKGAGTAYAPLIFTTSVLTAVLTNDTISTLYITNDDEVAGTLEIEALVDPTP